MKAKLKKDADVFRTPSIMVDGKKIKVNLDNELEITNISEDQSKVAAQMAYWSSVWSAAEAEKIMVDASYRRWRAQTGRKIIEREPKIAEWKVKQKIEAHSMFMKMKQAISIAASNAIIAKGIFESFRIKANALQSKGAQARAELDATGMTTRIKTDSDRADRVRRKIKKKK